MTPEEKAEALVLSFVHVPDNAMKEDSSAAWIDKILAKRCALIAVDEILNEQVMSDYLTPTAYTQQKEYWQQVKEHLQSL